jgi:hypothetical protein
LVFIACFSRNSVARKKSYQREELALAIDQMRLRNPDEPWLIPVRFDDCDIPSYDIGAGRSLTSIQRADLFGAHSEEATSRLVAAVVRILGKAHRAPSTGEEMPLPEGGTANVGLFVDLENLLHSKSDDMSFAELARHLLAFASSLGRLEKAHAIASQNVRAECRSAEDDFRDAGFLVSSAQAGVQSFRLDHMHSRLDHMHSAADVFLASVVIDETAALGLNRVVIVSADVDLLIPVDRLLEKGVTVRLVVGRRSFSNAWRRLADSYRSRTIATRQPPGNTNFDILVLEDLITNNGDT